MTEQHADSLRSHLQPVRSELALRADMLWEIAKPIHELQSREPGSVNGRAHCEMVESNIWRLITETNQLGNFSPLELFLLSCSACCHDFGKLEESLPKEFHGERSGKFVVEKAGQLVLSDPEAYAVNRVVSIHVLKADYAEALRELPDPLSIGSETFDLQRLALLVKTADVLHADNSRVESLTVDADKLTGEEREKYLARKCNYGWGINGDRVVFNALPQTDEERSAFDKCWKYLREQEWEPVARELRSYGFPFRIEVEFLGMKLVAEGGGPAEEGPPPPGGGDGSGPPRRDEGPAPEDDTGPPADSALIEELIRLYNGDVKYFLALIVPASFPAGRVSTDANPRVAYGAFARGLRGLKTSCVKSIFGALEKDAPGSDIIRACATYYRKLAGE